MTMTINKRLSLAALASVGLCAALNVQAQKVIPAYNTYQSVPFQVGGEGGMAQDVVDYLNDKLKGKYSFKLEVMPRDKFNQTVLSNKSFEGVSMFLAPMFVGDADKKKYLWTSPLMADNNLIISNPAKKVEWSGPDSLKGLKFGGVAGNRYAGLENVPRVADTATELNNLKNAVNGEIDVTLVPESVYRYYLKTASSARFGLDKLHVSSKNHASFTRHLFVSPDQAELAKDLEGVVAKMGSDPVWKALISKYGMKS
jgi:polar amino acid transport system substrate-binding protein